MTIKETKGIISVGLLLFISLNYSLIATAFEGGYMESEGHGPWNIYGTPVTVEKNSFARAGIRSLHVVTDNKDTMGGNYEGTSLSLGEYQPGDEIRISFWY